MLKGGFVVLKYIHWLDVVCFCYSHYRYDHESRKIKAAPRAGANRRKGMYLHVKISPELQLIFNIKQKAYVHT